MDSPNDTGGDNGDNDAIAQAMGFASFGAQHRPQKKRRYDQNPPLPPPPTPSAGPLTSQGTAHPSSLGERPASLPARPVAPGTTQPAGPATGGRAVEGEAQDGGMPAQSLGSRQPWYEGYYDHLSNENPWRHLEASMGLQPLGTWARD